MPSLNNLNPHNGTLCGLEMDNKKGPGQVAPGLMLELILERYSLLKLVNVCQAYAQGLSNL